MTTAPIATIHGSGDFALKARTSSSVGCQGRWATSRTRGGQPVSSSRTALVCAGGER